MSEEIMVSVCCVTYNQEKYIRKTLEGMVNQKTDFAFEILVHDDASTDRTPDIIKEFQQKYPNLIKPIFQTENQYSKKIRITNTFMFPLVKGKYTCLCEGDDYWCDNDKLQLQFNSMEANPECSICTHYVQPVNEDGSLIHSLIPMRGINSGIIENEQYAKWLLADAECTFQLSSYFIRSDLVHNMESDKLPEFYRQSPVGDEAMQRFCLKFGKLYFIDKVMSCYRVNSIGCWNIRENKSFEKKKEHCEKMKTMDSLYNGFSNGRFSKYIEQGTVKRDFILLLETDQFKQLRNANYCSIWNELKMKTKVKYILYSYFPSLKKIEMKIKNIK